MDIKNLFQDNAVVNNDFPQPILEVCMLSLK